MQIQKPESCQTKIVDETSCFQWETYDVTKPHPSYPHYHLSYAPFQCTFIWSVFSIPLLLIPCILQPNRKLLCTGIASITIFITHMKKWHPYTTCTCFPLTVIIHYYHTVPNIHKHPFKTNDVPESI